MTLPHSLLTLLTLLVLAPSRHAFSQTGQIRVTVEDVNGHRMAASASLASHATNVKRTFEVDDSGTFLLGDVPYGPYRLKLTSLGFDDSVLLLDVHSAVPLLPVAVMKISAVRVEVPVTDAATLLDSEQTGPIYHLGSSNIRYAAVSSPQRGAINLVAAQPGWLLEGNGVLHPRGAEYDTQYVLDGIPLFNNRSPAFSTGIDAEDLDSVNVMTSNFPAEFGRKLGGVIDATSTHPDAAGFHARASLQFGSFSQLGGFCAGFYRRRNDTMSLSLEGWRDHRYLDPPSLANFSNHGSNRGASLRGEHDFDHHDRLQMSLRYGRTTLQVPNEIVQERAEQRESRHNDETSGQTSYEHIFSPSLLGNIQARGRDVSSRLVSNGQSTPIVPQQNRGFREGYLRATLAGDHGRHSWKVGTDAIYASVREAFSYRITDGSYFDPGTPLNFNFAAGSIDQEQSVFAQDNIRLGKLTLSAGLRWDHYHLILDEQATSPRLGVAYYFPRIATVVHASYDRIFQTPAVENFLLASSQAARSLNLQSVYLPLRPSRGNYFEVGIAKSVLQTASLRLNYFNRQMNNFSDDDVLLNTGVSFPIAFHHASIYGFETKVEMPRWKRVSGYVSHSYLLGKASFPVAGGLFLGDDTTQLNITQRVPISQDQRNTMSERVACQISSRLYAAIGASYEAGFR